MTKTIQHRNLTFGVNDFFLETRLEWGVPEDARHSIQFDNFKPILNEMPGYHSGIAKIMKLISAIVAVGTNVAGDLTERTVKELAYVCRLMWPESHWMRIQVGENRYGEPSIHISATVNHGHNQMSMAGIFNVRIITGPSDSEDDKVPAFKRNKGNRTTAMRKVESLQKIMEQDAIQFKHHILTASGMKFPIHEINIIETNN